MRKFIRFIAPIAAIVLFLLFYIAYLVAHPELTYSVGRNIASEINEQFFGRYAKRPLRPNSSAPFCREDYLELVVSNQGAQRAIHCTVVSVSSAQQHCNLWWLGQRCYALRTEPYIFEIEEAKSLIEMVSGDICSRDVITKPGNERLREVCGSLLEHIFPFTLYIAVHSYSNEGEYIGSDLVELK